MTADTPLTRSPKKTPMVGQWRGHLTQEGPSWRGKWREDVRVEGDSMTRYKLMSKKIAPAVGEGAVSKEEAQQIFWDTVLSKLPEALRLSRCPIKQALPKSLASKIGPPTAKGCLPWLAIKMSKGYGQIRLNGRMQLAHRVIYELVVGPIPDGLCVLHRCDNPPCVNPEHLFTGTPQDNTDDSMRKGRHSSRIDGPCKRDEKGRFLPGRASQAGGLLNRAA